jgi:(2Fe-2S) ferredoxin
MGQVMTSSIVFCSLAAITADEPLIGSAKHNHAHFIMSLPKVDWGPKLAAMDGPAGDFARIIAAEDEAIFTLKNCPPEETGTIWLMPHGLRFDGLGPADYADLVNQTLNGEISMPSQPMNIEKLIFVCTHGLRDACCAKFGTVTLARLLELAPDDITVWESSHLGGHRFAGVMVVYPGARWYGRMTPDDIPALIESVQNDTVLLDHYRGNAGLPAPLQIAECWGLDHHGGNVHLLNPMISGNHAQVEVWHDGQSSKITLQGHPHSFRANCSDEKIGERLLWQIVQAEAVL